MSTTSHLQPLFKNRKTYDTQELSKIIFVISLTVFTSLGPILTCRLHTHTHTHTHAALWNGRLE